MAQPRRRRASSWVGASLPLSSITGLPAATKAPVAAARRTMRSWSSAKCSTLSMLMLREASALAPNSRGQCVASSMPMPTRPSVSVISTAAPIEASTISEGTNHKLARRSIQ